jgi:hypothetical protein
MTSTLDHGKCGIFPWKNKDFTRENVGLHGKNAVAGEKL